MPRAGVTPLRVIEEAETVADEVGLEKLTLAAVALRLGVRLPSLYKHTAGMDTLQRDLTVRARTELTTVLTTAIEGLEGEAAIVALAEEYRRWGHQHPGRYAATLRAPDPADPENVRVSAEVLDIINAMLGRFGLEDDDLVDAVRALRAAIHGFITLEQAGGFALPVDLDHSFRRMISGLTSAYKQVPREPRGTRQTSLM